MSIENLTLSNAWEKIITELNNNPEPFSDENLVYQFDITGEEEGTFQLLLQNGKAELKESDELEAQCTLKLSAGDFKKLLAGKLNSTAAYMTGKLKVKGNLGLALKMESMLKKYNFN